MASKYYDYTKSNEMFQRACKVIPSGLYGHQGPAEGCWIPPTSWPFFTDHAEKSYFWDVDGNKFIDYMCAYGPNVLGYNDPDVDAAAIEQAKKENCVTTPSTKILELAELMVDTVASADWAFFMKNGNDTTQGAIMEFTSIELARDLFDGKVNSVACIGEGTIIMGGMINMIDNINRILDRVALYLA